MEEAKLPSSDGPFPDLPAADEVRRRAEASGLEADYRQALEKFCEILSKLDGIDSQDIGLLGFGFDCYKSAVFLQASDDTFYPPSSQYDFPLIEFHGAIKSPD